MRALGVRFNLFFEISNLTGRESQGGFVRARINSRLRG
jgi:hypothetical protein